MLLLPGDKIYINGSLGYAILLLAPHTVHRSADH
jgi:hypothetical protein